MGPVSLGSEYADRPAYVAATFTSVALAVSLTRLVPRLNVSPAAKQLLGRLVPFASVASAGVVKWVSPWRAVQCRH